MHKLYLFVFSLYWCWCEVMAAFLDDFMSWSCVNKIEAWYRGNFGTKVIRHAKSYYSLFKIFFIHISSVSFCSIPLYFFFPFSFSMQEIPSPQWPPHLIEHNLVTLRSLSFSTKVLQIVLIVWLIHLRLNWLGWINLSPILKRNESMTFKKYVRTENISEKLKICYRNLIF